MKYFFFSSFLLMVMSLVPIDLLSQAVEGIGLSAISTGVSGKSTAGYGVFGNSTSGVGVFGSSTNLYGVQGQSTNSYGVYGVSSDLHGIHGFSVHSHGVYGTSTDSFGVYGQSFWQDAIHGDSEYSKGVYGRSRYSFGVYGISVDVCGVGGFSEDGCGVNGISFNGVGVRGGSDSNTGVSGDSEDWIGVYGNSTNSFGVRGNSENYHGSYFEGEPGFADIVLGSTNATFDDGTIFSDPTFPSSDIVLVSNQNMVVELDKNNDETGVFEVWDSQGDKILLMQEGGLFEIWNGANGANNRRLQLDVNGNLAIDGTLTEGSDRNRKENILPVNNHEVLQKLLGIPVSTWNYVGESTPHLGPMAQDFYQAFRLGATNKGIAGVDMQGVLLAATQAQQEIIEGLKIHVMKQEKIIQEQQIEFNQIKTELAKLKLLILESKS